MANSRNIYDILRPVLRQHLLWSPLNVLRQPGPIWILRWAYCLKIYPKICRKVILRHNFCLKMIFDKSYMGIRTFPLWTIPWTSSQTFPRKNSQGIPIGHIASQFVSQPAELHRPQLVCWLYICVCVHVYVSVCMYLYVCVVSRWLSEACLCICVYVSVCLCGVQMTIWSLSSHHIRSLKSLSRMERWTWLVRRSLRHIHRSLFSGRKITRSEPLSFFYKSIFSIAVIVF